MKKLLTPFLKNTFALKNHLVMAPMTRSHATGNIPNDLMVEYYGQRTGAGLIVTEGTSPSPNGLGYARIPGMFSKEHVDGWKKITEKVHMDNSKIFLQLMHTGRIGHATNLPAGVHLVGPSTIKAAGQIFTDTQGMQGHTAPVALSTAVIEQTIRDFVSAAKLAMDAGFDGVEIHGANGYQPEQFLNPNVNTRNDEYGGSIEKRSRFTVEIASRMAEAIGKGKVGIRFSPFSTLGDLAPYDKQEVHETYVYLTEKMESIGVLYIHIGANPEIPQETYNNIRQKFSGTLILCNGLTMETAEAALHGEFADLVAFGRSFLANPDLKERIAIGAELNPVDFNTLYTAGPQGYTDYPMLTK